MWTDSNYRIDWRDIAIYDENNIKGFFGDWRFLSNFWSCKVWFEGLLYPSSENAYMAAKTVNQNVRQELANLSPFSAKKLGHSIKIRDGWDDMRYDVMLGIVFNKFLINKDLRQKLLATGVKYLEELNWWCDQFWGVDYKLGGQNKLGEILMKVRTCLS